MDNEPRNLLIFLGVCALLLALFLGSCSYQANSCRMEAIKAGMKADDVSKACRV